MVHVGGGAHGRGNLEKVVEDGWRALEAVDAGSSDPGSEEGTSIFIVCRVFGKLHPSFILKFI